MTLVKMNDTAIEVRAERREKNKPLIEAAKTRSKFGQNFQRIFVPRSSNSSSAKTESKEAQSK